MVYRHKPKYANKVDLNHSPIRDRLKQIPGFEVKDTSKVGEDFPDLIVGGSFWDSGESACIFVEIKSKHGKLSEGQKSFQELWGKYIKVIEARSVSAILMQGFGWPEREAKDLDV